MMAEPLGSNGPTGVDNSTRAGIGGMVGSHGGTRDGEFKRRMGRVNGPAR